MAKVAQKMECPMCGTRVSVSTITKQLVAFGVVREHIKKVNGNLRTVIAIGAKIFTSYEVSAEDKLNTERVLKLLEENLPKLSEEWQTLQGEREQISNEREALEGRRKELGEKEKVIEELFAKNQEQINRLIGGKLEELVAKESEVDEKIQKLHELEKAEMPKAVKKELVEGLKGLEKKVEEYSDKINKTLYSAKTKGTKKELDTVRLLRELNTKDKIVPKGGRNEEDILAIVKDSGKAVGQIVLDVKDVKSVNMKKLKKWAKDLNGYGDKANAGGRILVTPVMPKDALSEDVHYWFTDDNVMVATPAALRTVYMAMRKSIIFVRQHEKEHQKEINLLQRRETTVRKVRKILENSKIQRYLNDAIRKRGEYDDEIRQLNNHVERRCKKFLLYNDEIAGLIQNAKTEIDQLEGALETA